MGEILTDRKPTGHLLLIELPTSDWKFASSYPQITASQYRRYLRGGLNHPFIIDLIVCWHCLYRIFPDWRRELPHTRTRNSSRLCDIPQSSYHTLLPPHSFLKGKRVQCLLSLSLSLLNWSEIEINRKFALSFSEWSGVWAIRKIIQDSEILLEKWILQLSTSEFK